MAIRNIQVFEHQSLKVGEQGFSIKHFKTLVQFNEKNGGDILVVGYNKITFTQYVGLISVGDLSIEVLPKADSQDKPDARTWRAVLVQMLLLCRGIRVEANEEALLRESKFPLYEILAKYLVGEVRLLLREGLKKQYVREENMLSVCKGRIKFGKTIARTAGNQAKFVVDNDEYTIDHSLHRLIKTALQKLVRVCGSSELRTELNSCASFFEQIRPFSYSESIDGIILDRSTKRYAKALAISQLVLQGRGVEPQLGNTPVTSFLFDMNKLFEDFIFRCLKTQQDVAGINVNRQVSIPFWEESNLRPDIVVIQGARRMVIDTKWKVNSRNSPTSHDLQQMFAYNRYFGATSSVLLYPEVYGLGIKTGAFHDDLNGAQHKCSLAYVSIDPDQNGRLNPSQVGATLWNALEKLK